MSDEIRHMYGTNLGKAREILLRTPKVGFLQVKDWMVIQGSHSLGFRGIRALPWSIAFSAVSMEQYRILRYFIEKPHYWKHPRSDGVLTYTANPLAI